MGIAVLVKAWRATMRSGECRRSAEKPPARPPAGKRVRQPVRTGFSHCRPVLGSGGEVRPRKITSGSRGKSNRSDQVLFLSNRMCHVSKWAQIKLVIMTWHDLGRVLSLLSTFEGFGFCFGKCYSCVWRVRIPVLTFLSHSPVPVVNG